VVVAKVQAPVLFGKQYTNQEKTCLD